MSYSQGHATGVDREVIKWLQDLELSFQPNNLRRDLSNGYLVAEIFSHYYPHDISILSFNNGVSFSSKQKNWSRIQKFLKKKNLELSKEAIYGGIHCEPGAAETLLQDIYNMLTNQKPTSQNVTDVQGQQSQHSSLSRTTSSRSFGNSLVAAGIMAESDISSNQRRAQVSSDSSQLEHTAADESLPTDSSIWKGAPVSYKEIKVNQPVRNSMLSPFFKTCHSNTENKKKNKSPKKPESG